ncbi:MAG: ABC transporter permease subunit, partial [Treponema sp.]|nr:ABC transporter permease subunit [Treponema sp.]
MKTVFKKSWRELKALAGDPSLFFIITLIFVSLALFIVYPLIKVIMVSFQTKIGGPFTLAVFKDVFASQYLARAFWNSIMMGVLTAGAGCLLGFLFAFAIARTDMPFKKIFHIIAIIPVVSPPFIGAMAIIMLFGNNGLITWSLLGIKNYPIYGFQGLLIAQVITFFPVAYITLRGVIESISPTLEDAALDLGGSRWKVFRKVPLPLTAPGIASAMLVLFIETMADFG